MSSDETIGAVSVWDVLGHSTDPGAVLAHFSRKADKMLVLAGKPSLAA